MKPEIRALLVQIMQNVLPKGTHSRFNESRAEPLPDIADPGAQLHDGLWMGSQKKLIPAFEAAVTGQAGASRKQHAWRRSWQWAAGAYSEDHVAASRDRLLGLMAFSRTEEISLNESPNLADMSTKEAASLK